MSTTLGKKAAVRADAAFPVESEGFYSAATDCACLG